MLLTRWLVVGLLTGLVVLITPSVIAALAQDSPARHTEAVATWTELLRDTLSASAGLSQAIVATAPLAPPTIAGPLAELSAGLQSGVPLIDGLRVFANTAADPGVDLVVCALLLAASARAQRLTELLGALAETIREEAALQLRIEASRAAARSGIRTVVVFSALFAGGLAVLAHAYLAPFGTLVGQCVLGAIGVAYMSGTLLMVRLTRPPAPFRLIGAVGSVQ
jgi:hypothetical protein